MIFDRSIDDTAFGLDHTASWGDIVSLLDGEDLDLLEDAFDFWPLGFKDFFVYFVDVDGETVILDNRG